MAVPLICRKTQSPNRKMLLCMRRFRPETVALIMMDSSFRLERHVLMQDVAWSTCRLACIDWASYVNR